MTPGESLRRLRETRPLVHQITNYVVMNETANATLALGGLPVMAHAREEVEEMVALAGALVLNIGTLSPDWVEAMLPRDAPRTRSGSPSCSIRSARARRRIAPRPCQRILDEVASPSCAATRARLRRSSASTPRCAASSRSACRPTRPSSRCRRRARSASSPRSPAPSTTPPTASASWRLERPPAARLDHRHRLHVSAVTGCFLARSPDDPLEAAVEALAAFGVAGEDAAREGKGPGSFHVTLYDALAALDPATLDERARFA